MKKPVPVFVLLMCLCCSSYSQTVKDIFDKAKKVSKKDKIFLKLEDDKLKYDIDESPKDFIDLDDSTIFMVKKDMNLYMGPLNPLHYSLASKINIIDDPIMIAANEALETIYQFLTKIPIPPQEKEKDIVQYEIMTDAGISFSNDCDITGIKQALEEIIDINEEISKEKVAENFKNLQTLSFQSQDKGEIEKELKNVNTFLSKADTLIDSLNSYTVTLKKEIEGTICLRDIDNFLLKTAMEFVIQNLNTLQKQHTKRMGNLREAYD